LTTLLFTGVENTNSWP
jgi:hypothetical protein